MGVRWRGLADHITRRHLDRIILAECYWIIGGNIFEPSSGPPTWIILRQWCSRVFRICFVYRFGVIDFNMCKIIEIISMNITRQRKYPDESNAILRKWTHKKSNMEKYFPFNNTRQRLGQSVAFGQHISTTHSTISDTFFKNYVLNQQASRRDTSCEMRPLSLPSNISFVIGIKTMDNVPGRGRYGV